MQWPLANTEYNLGFEYIKFTHKEHIKNVT